MEQQAPDFPLRATDPQILRRAREGDAPVAHIQDRLALEEGQ